MEIKEPAENTDLERPKTRKKAEKILSPAKLTLAIICGVVWPTLSLAMEISTGIAADIWIDPIPTIAQAVLIAWVPVSNAYLIYLLAQERAVTRSFFLLQGLSAGICIFYWIQLLPFTFFGVLLFWTGIGLLPLGPMAACVATFKMRKWALQSELATTPRKHNVIAVWSGIGLLVLFEITVFASAFGFTLAANGTPKQQSSAAAIMRITSFDKELARFASGDTAHRFEFYLSLVREMTGMALPSREDAAREIYRATGATAAHLHQSRWSWDPSRAGTEVGNVLKELALASSQAEIIANASEGYSYSEWTMMFQNAYSWQQEARSEVLLPPGGVVSRLTLWVNGEEREAAFAGSSEVREAYTKIVAQRRDPVLVTAAGPGRVMVQCFPVPPNGTMKIRLGITAPLLPETEGVARYRFPVFTDHNFLVTTPTTVSARGNDLLDAPGSKRKTDARGAFMEMTAAMDGFGKTGEAPSFLVRAPKGESRRWTKDARDPKGNYLIQTIRETKEASKAVFVIDGSSALKEKRDLIANAFATEMPQSQVIMATRRGVERIGTHELNAFSFSGGSDNVAALNEAIDAAVAEGAEKIVWIHGPQPVLLSPIAALNDKLGIHRNVSFVSVPLSLGENKVLAGMRYSTVVETSTDLRKTLRRLKGLEPNWRAEYSKVETLPSDMGGGEASSHLARLWAAEQVRQLIASDKLVEDPALLAARYQLVTAVSGAVVLETAKQYEEARLKPVDPGTVPAVPEPSTWALVALGVFGLALRGHFKKRNRVVCAGMAVGNVRNDP